MSSSSSRAADQARPLVVLLRTLEYGGAERQAVALASALLKSGRPVAVVVFELRGELESAVREAGVPLFEIGRRSWGPPGFLLRTLLLSRRLRPTAVLAYLDGPNLMSLVVKSVVPSARAFWGIRIGGFDVSSESRKTRTAYRLESWFARFANAAISNSHRGALDAVARGFPRDRTYVVPNGIDTDVFARDLAARASLRQRWDVPSNAIVIGLVGRLHPMKNVEAFVDAAGLLAASREDVRFVVVGGGPDDYSEALRRRASAAGLDVRLVWAGTCSDMPAVYSAFDLLTSASWAEGFSNAIGEAMACGVPCVATDVGDSAEIIGDVGEVVPPGSVDALILGWHRLLQRLPGLSPDLVRNRIVAHFSIQALVDRTLSIVDRE